MTHEEKFKEAKRLYQTANADQRYVLESLFPELKESEDEKIRKALIRHIAKISTEIPVGALHRINGVDIPDILAWLEKQGEQKPIEKVESKFKVGDFIVNDYCFGKVVEITNDAYLLDTGQGIPFSCEHNAHLWTIQDAKDGDVLVDVYGNISIYEKCDDFDWMSYCSLGHNGGFQHFKIEHENEKTYPATKEQRDLLFQKMKEAGYEWDSEKKVLKKIEQQSEKSKWTEEDEKNWLGIMDEIEANKSNAPDYDIETYDRYLSWLESLKQRMKE